MLDRILKYFGYINVDKLEEEDLAILYGKFVGYPADHTIDKKEEEIIFRDLKKVNGLTDLLKTYATHDMQRAFSATTEKEDGMAHGAFARTVFFRGRIIRSGEPKESNKLDGLRYG